MNGIVIKAIAGFYYVNAEDRVYECKARGSLRNAGVSPVVGDRVEFTPSGKNGVVEGVFSRKNILERPVVANIDRLFIVSSFITPAPDSLMIDRLTALSVFNGIEPVIVFNKCDMGDFSAWKSIYENAGFKCFTVSAKTGEGIENIVDCLKECVCAFAGNSGVGKSSILNSIFPELELKTGEVSEKLGRGRHTTRHTQLFAHKYGGYVADTPGFSSVVATASADLLKLKNELAECFPDFNDYSDCCRFNSCTHTCEKGCAVLEAVASGQIERSRHESYKAMFDELRNVTHWNTKGKI